MSFTMEDCDNPETAFMICIMINIANGNNYFSHWKPIYKDLDFKNNPHLQRDCVIASYHNGAEDVIDAYNAGVLMNTYLNMDTNEGEYLKRFYNNKIECDRHR